MNTVQKGTEAETSVCKYLENSGYKIVCRNFRTREGEIDIIAVKNNVVCAVEVKKLPDYWDISEIENKIPSSKICKIKKTMAVYLANYEDCKYDEIRFDAAAVIGSSVKYWEGAF